MKWVLFFVPLKKITTIIILVIGGRFGWRQDILQYLSNSTEQPECLIILVAHLTLQLRILQVGGWLGIPHSILLEDAAKFLDGGSCLAEGLISCFLAVSIRLEPVCYTLSFSTSRMLLIRRIICSHIIAIPIYIWIGCCC